MFEMMRIQWMLLMGAVLILSACQPDPTDELISAASSDDLTNALMFGALPQTVDVNGNGRQQQDRVRLGRLLFYDPILSGEKDVSCATCHHPAFGYGDGRDLPIGVGGVGLGPGRIDASNGEYGIVGRNAPTVINTVFNGIDRNGNYDITDAPMFWDNRANSLEEQALGPPHSFEEMRGHAYSDDVTLDSLVERLENNREYRDLFRRAFDGQRPVTSENIATAIADFERTIVANNSPFDRFVRGDDGAMTRQQKDGLRAFIDAGCGACHSGPMFSDYELHAIGVVEHPDRPGPDAGANGTFRFRTPTLRNLDVTAPYFHNGIASNLQEVMTHYLVSQDAAQAGGSPSFNTNVPELSPLLAAQQLQENQVDDIIAFMDALNDDDFDRGVPDRVPSRLPVGGNISLTN